MSRTLRIRLLTVVVLLLPLAAATAQPDLNFKRIRLDWPYVELYFSVGCNGVKNYSLNKSDVRLFEDGRELTDFGLWCPDPSSRCPITVGLVFDASDSMTGEGSAGAKDGGAAFIGNMDHVVDEACVIHFNTSVWVYQHMTTDTVRLKSAVSQLPTFGATALWDAIWTALAIVQNNGHNQCRAVIVLSDGEDNSSTRHGLSDIIEFAVRYNIRVFPIGYGEHIAADDLRYLAEMTGGAYYQTPDASDLARIYQDISTILYDYFQECVITYDPRCGDEKSHEIALNVLGICGGDAVLKRSYIAPMDSSTFVPRVLALGGTSGMGGEELRVPIELRSPYFRELFYPLSISLRFDRSALQLIGVETPPGTLLAGMPIHIADLSNGGTVRVPEARVLDGSGVLAHAVFKAVHHVADAEYPLVVESATFDKGCIVPMVEAGTVRVSRSRPVPTCALDVPTAVSWDGTRHRYTPDPIIVRAELGNAGTLPAVNGAVELQYDAMAFDLLDASPIRMIDTLHANGQVFLQWRLVARPQAVARTMDLCVVSTFASLEESRCCASVQVPPAGMLLDCALELPALQYQQASKSFVPNPFDLSLTITNPGAIESGALSALLQLPEGMYIESGERYEKPLPLSPLPPGGSTSVSWRLRLLSYLGGERLPIRIELRNDGLPYRACTDTLPVPSIPSVFEPPVLVLGPTAFCEGDSITLDAGEGFAAYRWNTGEKTRYLVVRIPGSYFVTVRDAQGNVGQSPAVSITVIARPPKPEITRTGNVLHIQSGDEVTWLRNGVVIGGANTRQLVVGETGAYTVRVRNASGCVTVSDPFIVNVLSTGTPAIARDHLTVHPQPARSELLVRVTGPTDGGSVTLRLVDLLGRVRITRAIRHAIGASHAIDIAGTPRGVYILTASWATGMLVTKVLVE